MIPTLRAEARKLLTIRSTYILMGVMALLTAFISFWVLGYKGSLFSSHMLYDAADTSTTFIGVFAAITAVLLIAHEYRFNTIMYTLTAANSRSKVLAAKIVVASAYVVLATLVTIVFAVLCTHLGVAVRGGSLVPQTIEWWPLIWHAVVFVWGYTMVGMIVAVLVRHVVGAIVVLLIGPSTIETLLALLLKDNSKYLPFSALEQIKTDDVWSPLQGAGIFLIYVVLGWAVAWILFLRRDAN